MQEPVERGEKQDHIKNASGWIWVLPKIKRKDLAPSPQPELLSTQESTFVDYSRVENESGCPQF